jgi:hypothetical protein
MWRLGFRVPIQLSPTQTKKTEETKVKKTVLARTLLGLAVLLIGVAALAQDSDSNIITINGGRTTVLMKAPSNVVHNQSKPPDGGAFYCNLGSGYQAGVGWTVSDGSPIGTEYTPGNQIVSVKTGTTKMISVGVGFVTGTNGGKVTLDKDCNGVPCGTIDQTHLCRGQIHNLPNFGSTSTAVRNIKCVAKLTKGQPYWVYVESLDNSWLAWNLSTSALGGLIEGTNDVWGTPSNNANVGALKIK